MDIKKKARRAFIMSAIAFMAFVPAVLFTSCNKGDGKNTGKDEKPEYVYEADFKELGNLKMNSLSRSCFNNGKVYTIGTEDGYGKDGQVNSSKNYLLQFTTEGSGINKVEISFIRRTGSTTSVILYPS